MFSSLLRTGLRAQRMATVIPVRAASTEAAVSEGSMRENYQLGDYPSTPFVSRQIRNPYLYEDLHERRNFGEAIHEQDEVLAIHAPDPYYEISTRLAAGSLLTMFGALFLFYKFLEVQDHPSRRPAVKKSESKHKSPMMN